MTESQLESFDFDTLKIVQSLCQSDDAPVPNIEKRLHASEKMLREIWANCSHIKKEEPENPCDVHTQQNEEVLYKGAIDPIIPEVTYILRRLESILAMNEKDVPKR